MARFGELLKHYRKERDVTQDGLARLTGLATSTISKLESTDLDMEPGWRTVQKIAAVLGLDVQAFVEEEVMENARIMAQKLTQAWSPLPTEPAEMMSIPEKPKTKKEPQKKGKKS